MNELKLQSLPETNAMTYRQAKPLKGLLMLILSFVFFLLAIFSLPLVVMVGQEAAASSKWPSVRGEVTQAKVNRIDLIKKKEKYQAEIRFRYQVDRTSYTGSRIRYLDTTGSSQKAQRELISPYPAGRVVDVYYDPDKPGTSVLEPGSGSLLSRLVFYLIPFILGGISVFFYLAPRQPVANK